MSSSFQLARLILSIMVKIPIIIPKMSTNSTRMIITSLLFIFIFVLTFLFLHQAVCLISIIISFLLSFYNCKTKCFYFKIYSLCKLASLTYIFYLLIPICTSFNCFSSTIDGALINKSLALLFFGKAITSLIF